MPNALLFIGRLFCLWALLHACTPTEAQQTRVYTDPNRLYEQATERFEEGNYPLAQHDFALYKQQCRNGTTTTLAADCEGAAYYNALCAVKMKTPDAEMLLAQFIDEHESSAWAGRAYYELGKIYFAKKAYKDAIYCYEKADAQADLSAAERGEYYFQLAYSYFVSKDFGRAKDAFAEIINTNNDYYYDANYYYGVLAYFDKQYTKALESFQRVEKSPKYSKALPYYIALIYYFQNKPDDLLKYSTPLAADASLRNQKELNQLIGQTYFNRKQFTEALPYLQFYVEKTGKVRKEDLYQLGYCQYQAKQYDKAIGNFSELNSLRDTLGQNAMYNLADCYLKTNDKAKAMNAFDAASRDNFDPQIKEISSFNYAKLSYEQGFHSNAISRLQDFINKYPSSAYSGEAKRLLSAIFETTRNYREALSTLEGITAKSPDMQKAYQRVAYLRGVELFNDRKWNDATDHFDKALDNPYDADITAFSRFWKADIAYKNKQYEDAFNGMENFLGSVGSRNLSEKVNPATAQYTLGYILFKEREYADALVYFDATRQLLDNNPNKKDYKSVAGQVFPDATLRSADCSFMLRRYDQSLALYNSVIEAGGRGVDYAYYQKGMLQGLNGDYAAKIATLNGINDRFSGSSYIDDALYQTAITQVAIDQPEAAIATHRKLIDEHPESEYVRKSLVNLGLIYYNRNDYERALQFYELVLKRFPKSSEAQEAVDGVRDVYISKQDSDGFAQFIRKFPDLQISNDAQDSLNYQIAESYYTKADCDNATKEFTKYLSNYPNGAYTLYARFYRGQCLYSQQDYAKAAKDYDFIINDAGNNVFTERALDKGGRIALYIDKDYDKAYRYARKLYETASRPDLKTESLRALVRATYYLKKAEELDFYADLLRKEESATGEDQTDTYFYIGLLAYQQGNSTKAKTNLTTAAQRTTNEQGAQARYYLADIAYKAKDFDAAKALCFKVINETASQEYWVVKAFILLSDIYVSKNEPFQAKATLQSVIDNYKPEDELKKEAREKLAQLQQGEAAKSKLKSTDKPKGKDGNYLEMDENK